MTAPLSFRLNLDYFTAEAERLEKARPKIKLALKNGAHKAVLTWFARRFPEHFALSAAKRYQYQRRKESWYRRKQARQWVRNSNRELRAAPRPVRDNVYSLEMHDATVGQLPMVKRLISSYYRGQYRLNVRASIPIPHPVRTEYHNEITRVAPDEYTAIGEEAMEHAAAELEMSLGWKQQSQSA